MGNWTPEQLSAVIGAFTAIILAIFSKPVAESIMSLVKMYREGVDNRMRRRALDEELNEKGHKWVIRRQDKRIDELEKALDEIRNDHAKCREEYTALRVSYDNVLARLAALEAKRSLGR